VCRGRRGKREGEDPAGVDGFRERVGSFKVRCRLLKLKTTQTVHHGGAENTKELRGDFSFDSE